MDEKPSVLSSTEEVKKDNSEADDQVSEVIVDTTDQHRAHLFDLNCKICTGKQAPMTPEPEVKKVKVEHKVKVMFPYQSVCLLGYRFSIRYCLGTSLPGTHSGMTRVSVQDILILLQTQNVIQ